MTNQKVVIRPFDAAVETKKTVKHMVGSFP